MALWEFPKIRGTLFRVIYWGPLFSETPLSRAYQGFRVLHGVASQFRFLRFEVKPSWLSGFWCLVLTHVGLASPYSPQYT